MKTSIAPSAFLGKHCRPADLVACLEQAGHYGRAVARALFVLHINALYLVNPRQIKALANQRLRRNKSDSADAQIIADIRAQIDRCICEDETLADRYLLLETIRGLGDITCQTLLAELPDLELFGNARQLAAWDGLTPRHHVSGTSGRPTTPIPMVGSANLRKVLFFPAMNANTFNPLFKEFAHRLEGDGKTGKQIVVAVIRKLLHQIFGVLKSGQPFNTNKRGLRFA